MQERPAGRGGLPGAVPEDGPQDLDELPLRLCLQPGRYPRGSGSLLTLAGQNQK